jgi:hypothetical protein
MSQDNVEVVRRSGFTQTEDLAWELMDPEIEVHDHDLPDVGVYRGHAGVREWTAHWDSVWETWEMASPEYVDAGQKVVLLFTMRATGKASGITLEREGAIIFSFTGATISRIDYYNNPSQALEAAGLRE